jgi:transposase
MLFGARTENKRNVLKENTGNDAGKQQHDNQADAAPGDQGVAPASDRPLKGNRPGHGRNGVQAYGGTTVVPIEHPSLKSGDQCPGCPTGKVYAHEPREFVQGEGQPPLAATIYQIERLRCRLCDAVLSAPMPRRRRYCTMTTPPRGYWP